MKQSYFKIFFAAAFISLFFSCKKYEYFQTNPNQASTATPGLLLTNICISVFDAYPTEPAFASRQLTYYEREDQNQDYNWTRASFGNYDILRQVARMDTLALQANNKNYDALAKFFRAVLFDQLSETFGDIPYSEALQGAEGNTQPKYDAQEDVYAGILNELEEANTLLDEANGTISGDIIYNGDITHWKKLVNAYHLRLLMDLSKRAGDSKIDIKQQFQNIISNPDKYPIMESNDDNGQIVFNSTSTSNYYPTAGYLSLGTSISMEEGFVDILKERKDPRLFSIAQPIAGLAPNVFDNYAGVNGGLTLADQQTASADASRINSRYYDITRPVNEPLILLGYPEQEFIIAEAIARGWINGDAEQHYKNGITSSMAFYNIDVPAGYLDEPNVKYDAANAIPLIITQKYIALFMQSGWQPFYEQRRTGIPHFNVGPGTYNDRKIPKRWEYPQSEYDYNKANVEAAVQKQYNGNDDVNEVMWLIK